MWHGVCHTACEPSQITANGVTLEQPQSCCALYHDCHREPGAWRVPQHHPARGTEAGSRGAERKPTGTHTEDTGVPYSPEHLGRALWAAARAAEGRALHIQFTDQLLFQLLVWISQPELLLISHIICHQPVLLILCCSRHLWRRAAYCQGHHCPKKDVGDAFSL